MAEGLGKHCFVPLVEDRNANMRLLHLGTLILHPCLTLDLLTLHQTSVQPPVQAPVQPSVQPPPLVLMLRLSLPDTYTTPMA